MIDFQLTGIDPEPFRPLFDCSDVELRGHGSVRRVATESPGFPCRVSLEDAEVGDELLLVSYRHLPVASPYRGVGPIFIRRGASRAQLAVGAVPPYVTRRLISLRAYDAADMMVAATVCEGVSVASEIERHFGDAAIAYLQLHNAKQGCFSCQVDRVR
jgi:Protein of unknown function (DUF1203)